MTSEELKSILKEHPAPVQHHALILIKAANKAESIFIENPSPTKQKVWEAAKEARDQYLGGLTDKTENEVQYAGGKVIVGTEYVGHFFGVEPRAVRYWVDAGCTKLKRNQYDLKAVFDWWWSNIAQDRAIAEATDNSINEAKRIYWWEKAEGEKVKNKRESEQLIPRQEIAAEWAARVSEIANGLQALSMRLPPLIAGKEAREVRDIVKLNVRQILENYSRTGRFCQKVRVAKEPTTAKKKRKPANGAKSKTR